MEKQDHKKELNPPIHPTLSVYLSGNFNDQPVDSFNANSSSNRGESVKSKRCAYLEKLNKNKLQTASIIGGRIRFIILEDIVNVESKISILQLGCLQLLVSGLHIAWGIWRVDFKEPWFHSINGVFIFIIMSFYVGAIIGGIIVGCFIHIWRKQAIYVNRLLEFIFFYWRLT